MGCVPCRPWSHRRYCNAASYPQNSYCRLLIPRIQTRRNQSRVVDQKMVQSRSCGPCYVSIGSRIRGADYRIVTLEWRSTPGHLVLFMLTPPLLIPYVDTLHATILCKHYLGLFSALRSWPAFSLITAFEADLRTAVHLEAEETAPLDCEYIAVWT
jgi:hypothetical protein